LCIDATADFHAMGQPGWCLGAALTAAGNADRAAATMLEAFDGPELAGVLPVDRSLAAADLIEAHLARDDLAAATDMLARAGSAAAAVGTAWAAAVAGNARAAVLLAAGQPAEAVSAAAAARQAASAAPLTAARSLLLEGRALAGAGRRRAAIETLVAAESELDALGARRRRDEAVRELRRLGHRVVRAAGGPSDDPLTAREREVAELAADGRTNREIAEQLVLSDRTIEAHLRNVYAKLGVRSRVELTRELRAFGAG
jgi:ATP/maltotriose-dependent transcriptional regulator MalT